MRNFLLLLLGLIPELSISQILHLPELRAPLQTTTYSKLQVEALSFSSNQAALALFTKPAFGVYCEKRYMLQELALFTASAVFPSNSGNFGFATRRFGSAVCNETEAGLAYGRKLSDKAAIGAQFNYRSFKVNGYGIAVTLSVDASALFQVSDQVLCGFHVYKPAGTIKGKEREMQLASVYEAGLGYDVSRQLFLTVIANKVEGMKVQATAAVQYLLTKSLLCKAGVSTGSSSFYFGAGLGLKHFRLDAITSFHQNLGIAPGIQLLYQLSGE